MIVGTCYINNESMADVVRLWGRLTRHLNPETPILVVDSDSPIDPGSLFNGLNIQLLRLPDNIGHPFRGDTPRGDGSMRALFTGMKFALERASRATFIECDIMLCRSATEISRGLRHPALFPVDQKSGMLENGLGFYDLTDPGVINFISDGARRDWRKPLSILTETWFAEILNPIVLPLVGYRDDGRETNPLNVPALDYLTHSSLATYKQLIELNGIVL